MLTLADCLVPDWPAPPRVRALVTTRRGGCSLAPYDSLNLGVRVGDDPTHVARNRASLLAHLPGEPRWLTQVHGAEAVPADAAAEITHADASFTSSAGVVCTIQMADCLPVLFAADDASVVAAAHAGWRGLAAGVLDNTVSSLPVSPDRLVAWLGPAIGQAAFEVGNDVREAFLAGDVDAAEAFRPGRPGKWFADLYALARRRLARCGVTRVHGGGLCTFSDAARFFSHRRDGVSGRMAAMVWID